MRKIFYIALIILFSFLISLNTFKVFSIEEVSIFLTVIGIIYGLITAFTISNSWEKFSRLRDAVSEETSLLESIYTYSKYLTDGAIFRKIKNKILEYCREVPKIEWKDYKRSEKTHKKFREIANLISSIKIHNSKDQELFAEILDDLRTATSSRNMQLVLSQTRISGIQWILTIFLSLILIAGLALLSFQNYILSIFIVSSMVVSIILILFIMYEIDSLKVAETEVFIEPYDEVVRFILKDKE